MTRPARGGQASADGASRRLIDRSSALPLYAQLEAILREEIARRQLQPGDPLPGDYELCEAYGVSRTVVRQALADLRNEGLLERVKGRGTFVTPRRISRSLARPLTGLHEDVAALGRQLVSDVRRLEVAPADDEVAARLQVPPGTPVVVLERLRFVDDEPWVHTVSHVPVSLAPDLADQELRYQSLHALLEGRYGHRLVRVRRVVEARNADPRLARDLAIPRNGAVLKLTNVSLGPDAIPVETSVAHHRGDRFRFEGEFARRPGNQPARRA